MGITPEYMHLDWLKPPNSQDIQPDETPAQWAKRLAQREEARRDR